MRFLNRSLPLPLFVFFVLFLFVQGKGAESSASKQDREKRMEEKAKKAEFHNVIAGQRVLVESVFPPPTRLDLTHQFEKIDALAGTTPTFRIIETNNSESGKSEIVKATLEGNTLVLDWRGIGATEITLEATNPDTGINVYDKIRCEAWKPDYWMMTFTVIGGIGIFLIGMKYMSDGLQTVAGQGLRRMIAVVTENRFLAICVGIFTTAVIQSSTVTTVMVVGFVNSQIMTLSQAIGVIMGANIGTTVTGWILVLNIGKYGLPIVGLAGFVYLFTSHERTRFIAMAIMGLGFLFFGLELMQKGFAILCEMPQFAVWMKMFNADSYFGVWKCIGIGCLVTLTVHSSAATLAITMSLATIGIIPFETAGALVLGENIGTTITAFVAAMGTSGNARRAALFHVLFNVIGVIWVSAILLTIVIPTIKMIVGTNDVGEIKDITKGIALIHTMFNSVNTILFLPFVKMFANLLTYYIPEQAEKEKKSHLTSLHMRLLETSSISIERSRIEILRMSNGCTELAKWVREIDNADIPDEKLIDEAFHQEEVLDTLQDEIIEFIAELLSGNISHEVAEIARGQLRMADELESISDYLIVILKSTLKLRNSSLSLPEPVKTQIAEVHHQLETYMRMIHEHYAARFEGVNLMTEVYSQGRSITVRVKTIRDMFLKQMSEERLDPQVIMAVNTQLNAYRRVREHSQNVAEAVVGVK